MADENKYIEFDGSRTSKPKTEEKKIVKDIRPEHIHPNTVKGPVVVFFGPREVGKTVALLRLSHHITNHESCNVSPSKKFRTDSEYSAAKSTFNQLMGTTNLAPERTANLNFLLIDVFENNKKFCQILEAPGEHFFSTTDPTKTEFLPYLTKIMINSVYKKVFVFFFEDGMLGNDKLRRDYANRIAGLLRKINSNRDKVIFLYNKVDEAEFNMKDGIVNHDDIKDEIFNDEANQPFINYIKQTKGFKNVHFVGFSSGSFYPTPEGDVTWDFSHPRYPKKLWNTIHQCIKKRGWWS